MTIDKLIEIFNYYQEGHSSVDFSVRQHKLLEAVTLYIIEKETDIKELEDI